MIPAFRVALATALTAAALQAQTLDTQTSDRLPQTYAIAFDLLAGQVPSHGRAWWMALFSTNVSFQLAFFVFSRWF